jgi:hypothetical protein
MNFATSIEWEASTIYPEINSMLINDVLLILILTSKERNITFFEESYLVASLNFLKLLRFNTDFVLGAADVNCLKS